jgi:hypothetical protein
MNKVIIDSKELAVGSWVKNNDEIARITSLYKKNGMLVAEAKLYDDSSDISTDEILLYPSGIEPIPVTILLLEKNGWVKDKTDANVFTHPQLGSDNKIVIKDDVPVFHDQKVMYVHQLQNVLHEHNENISIHLQLFKI